MWQHNYEPLAGSLGWSALVAAIPVAVLFFMLGVKGKPTWMAATSALGSALVVAVAVYRMPPALAISSALYGAAFGIFPIAWICFSSILLYRIAVDSGKFETIKNSVGGLTNDRRLQAMFIAFSFGASIEGAAGFGARNFGWNDFFSLPLLSRAEVQHADRELLSTHLPVDHAPLICVG